MSLKDRTYFCDNCHMEMDRDKNASKNILTEGIRLYRTEHKTFVKKAA